MRSPTKKETVYMWVERWGTIWDLKKKELKFNYRNGVPNEIKFEIEVQLEDRWSASGGSFQTIEKVLPKDKTIIQCLSGLVITRKCPAPYRVSLSSSDRAEIFHSSSSSRLKLIGTSQMSDQESVQNSVDLK